MRKVFLDDLPKRGLTNQIDWKNSVGHIIKFKYDNIVGNIEIIKYFIQDNRNYITTKYKNIIKTIWIGDVKKAKIGNLLGLIHIEYIYQVGDIINNLKYGKILILKQNKMKYCHQNRMVKGYECKCLNCGDIFIKTEDELKRNGCAVCSGRKILKGVNDLWSTNPYTAKLLKYPEKGYKVMEFSNSKEIFVCPDCGFEKNITIGNISSYGFSCSKCGDSVSYPEKFMFNVLEQLNLNFQTQLSKSDFKWCKNYKYDFYFEYNNKQYIIETHGKQHYEEGFERIKSNKKVRTLEQEQENDRLKKELALKNGIKEENYIIIDCRKSELEFIKNNIIHSKLNDILALSKIDWVKCEENALKNRIKEACTYWNKGIHSTKEIGKIMKIHRGTVCIYLKRGKKLKWTNYNPKEVMRNNSKITGRKLALRLNKKVICINTKKVYISLTNAELATGINRITIGNCCKGKGKSAGKDIYGNPLIWKYYCDYNKEDEIYYMNNTYTKIICINTHDIFNSINSALNKYKTYSSSISACCQGKLKSAGKHPITGEKLKWMYYDDYLKLTM